MLSIDKEILRLAVPSIVSNITVPLLGLVDLAIAGHLASPSNGGGEAYIAAISVGSMIFNLIYWLMGFLRMGTSGMTGQAYGADNWQGVKLLLRRSLTLSLIIASIFLVLQYPLREATLAIIHPSADVWQLATTYFNIVIWGAPAMLSLYSLNGWFIGMQNTRVPMVVAIAQNIVNIIASLSFVYGLGMKIEGIALGTLVAQWSGVLMSVWFVKRILKTSLKKKTNNQELADERLFTWKKFFTVDRDIFLRTVCLVAVNLAFTSAGARQGDMMLAVNTLLMTFFTLFSYIMDGFAFAGEALAGRYYGARDHDGLATVVSCLLRHWGIPMAVIFTLIYVVCGQLLLHLLTDDTAVIISSQTFFLWACAIPLAGMAGFIYDGIFIGLTATRGMLLSSFISSVTFFTVLALSLLLPIRHTHPMLVNHMLWAAFIIYLFMRGFIQHLIMRKHIAI